MAGYFADVDDMCNRWRYKICKVCNICMDIFENIFLHIFVYYSDVHDMCSSCHRMFCKVFEDLPSKDQVYNTSYFSNE